MMTGLVGLMFAIAFQTGYSDFEEPRYEKNQTGQQRRVIERILGLPVFPVAEPERWFLWVGSLAPVLLGLSFLSGLAWAGVGATGWDLLSARVGVLGTIGNLAFLLALRPIVHASRSAATP